MKHKIVKLARKFRWSWPARDGVPVFWHIGRPNFGDDINPWLWSTILERRVHLSRQKGRHLLGAGSILEKARDTSVVVGGGLLREPVGSSRCPGRIVAVRGIRTAEAVGAVDALLGDPVVLVDRLFPQPRKIEFANGFVPHVTQVNRFRATLPPDCRLIDPRWPPLKVLAEVCRCERVFSQSLHGLIVSDAYGVPNVWVAPSETMVGGEFKFVDYYSTTETAKTPVEPRRIDDLLASSQVDAFVSRFRYSKKDYLDVVRRVVSELFPRARSVSE
ncbi:MAG: polysaccharide pyruvyl transferase family protein [Pirellulaceae bacterium]|nr:polysaccharide pyruvyl transferase family protein [Pirellulaceae bacterium]